LAYLPDTWLDDIMEGHKTKITEEEMEMLMAGVSEYEFDEF
jgi:hypothetical protein